MIIIHTALKWEAEPLINFFNLVKDTSLPCSCHRKDDIILFCGGIGKEKTCRNTELFFNKLKGNLSLSTNPLHILNIGLCGAREEHSPGEAFLVKRIAAEDAHDFFETRTLEGYKSGSLTTVSNPLDQATHHGELPELADMEAFYFFKTAGKYLPVEKVQSFKIVSDNYDLQNFDRELVVKLVSAHLEHIDKLIDKLQDLKDGPAQV